MRLFKKDNIKIIRVPVNPLYRGFFIYMYFIDGVLVDAGPSIQKRKLAPIFQTLEIKKVAITHYHSDHVGMIPWIVKHLQADVFCHEKTLGFLADGAHLSWYNKLFNFHSSYKGKTYPTVIRTPNYELYPVETPGHTPGHVCLFEPTNGWLFTGDLYVTPYPKVFLKNESITAYIDSLQKLSELKYETVYCSHEGVVTNGKDMMNRKLDYLQQTQETVIQLHKQGRTDREIIKELFPKNVKLEIMSFGGFSRRNFIRSCYRE